MITEYLRLDEAQEAKLRAWIKALPEYTGVGETCNMAGREFTFTAYQTGIGDVLYVKTYPNHVCYLSYDDDGELL